MMKRITALLLASVMIFLAACATTSGAPDSPGGVSDTSGSQSGDTSSSNAGTNDSDPQEQITLRFTGWGDPGEQRATQNVIRAYENANPHVSVEYIHIPAGEYITVLTTMIAGGEGPDMGMLFGTNAIQWAQEGQLADLNSRFQADPAFSLNEIMPQAVYWVDEDSVIGINSAIVSFALFYSNEALAEAGITVPDRAEDAWTWDEFVYNLQLLTLDVNGNNATDPDFDPGNIERYGLYLTHWALLELSIAMAEESFLTADETSVNIVGTRIEEALQRFSDLINVYHVAPDPAEAQILPGGTVALLTGQTAMTMDGSWCIMDLADNDVDFGIGVMPKMWNKPATITLGEPFVIFDTCEYPEEAYELLRMFMQPEHSMELIAGGLWKPVLKQWYEDEDLVSQWAGPNDVYPPSFKTALMKNTLENGVPTTTYTVRNIGRIMDVISPALDTVWAGDNTVAEAMAGIQSNMDAEVQGMIPRPN